jgi:hypothetical protein
VCLFPSQPQPQQPDWGHIPADIIVQHLAPMLEPQELARCCGVCMEWFRGFGEDSLWRPRCVDELPAMEALLRDMPIPSYK